MCDATCKLCYCIDGRRNVSSIPVTPNESIEVVKEKIYRKAPNFFSQYDAQVADIILTKVCYIMISLFMNTDVINDDHRSM